MHFGDYIIFGMSFAGVFFLAAAYFLYWAVRKGQFNNLQQGARSIFDEDEPEGQVTDSFPGKPRPKLSDHTSSHSFSR